MNILRYAVQINGLTELALTKLDILSGIDQIPVCIGYELDGQTITHFPADHDTLSRCLPITELLPGWTEDIMNTHHFENLPPNARAYVNYVAQTAGVPVRYVSVGPGRDQVIRMV
jgi:adenylosuccinate synthase